MAVVFRQQTRGPGGVEIVTTVVGIEKALAAVRAVGADVVREMGGALYREGLRIIAASRREVPVRDGILRSTWHVELPQVASSGETVVELGYGGPSAPYALRQHEELSYRHTVGKAKYLEDPFRAHVPTMDARLAADITRRATKLRGGA